MACGEGCGRASDDAVGRERAEEVARDVVVEAPIVATAQLRLCSRRDWRYWWVIPRVMTPLWNISNKCKLQSTHFEFDKSMDLRQNLSEAGSAPFRWVQCIFQ